MKPTQYTVPVLALVITALGLFWALNPGSCSQSTSYAGPRIAHPEDLVPHEVGVTDALAVDLVKLEDGHNLRLSGVGANLNPFEKETAATMAREHLKQLVVGKRFVLHPDLSRPADYDELRGELFTVGADGTRKSINEELLRTGDALLDLTRGPAASDERFRTAAALFANPHSRRAKVPLGFQCGIALPLYSKEPDFDYGPRLKEIKDHGATWVSLLFVWIINRMDSIDIEQKCNQSFKGDNRSPSDEVLARTIKQAKDLGLRVLLIPIVLPWHPGPDDWRGNLRPTNREGFFENYGQFILRHADLAESLGADAYSIGSELIKLEGFEHESDTDGWRRIVRSVRSRFGGRLTYSANWDHYDVLGIIDELDFVGLTAYNSLTKDPDATVDQIAEAWMPFFHKLNEFSEEQKRNLVFTEVGYFSIRGTNTDPWNYKMNDRLDLDIQKRCYEAFAKVFGKPTFLAGAYFFDFYDDGGPNDKSYSPRGKPAAEVMKKYFESARNLPPPRYDPAKK
ncbi:MAG: hypothetical protein HY286_11790 [Planctomycetes bacterium]|nr:hypothetical protein [Planctomycetota bacterium]